MISAKCATYFRLSDYTGANADFGKVSANFLINNALPATAVFGKENTNSFFTSFNTAKSEMPNIGKKEKTPKL